MKKVIVLIICVLLAFSIFTFLARLLPEANATYVEGEITQDTVWMLIDSPFIVINNVTVRPGVTLRIEPGVEVRFGGNFSLDVEGTLIAEGTEERPITFTSNKYEGELGDWIGIRLAGASSSSLSYCIVKYAVHGVIVENSSPTISNCEIIENLKSGIMIVGNSSLTVDNSKILLNENGILPINLNFNSSQHVTIRDTVISSNSFSGILINGTVWNLEVINCNIMSNHVGVYISRNTTNITITNNSIAYNEYGVLFDHALQPPKINYNDIYNNTLAMRSSNSTTPINATYNYWGENGPYHISLNPDGKGNPIESNGTDIDFIPFLTSSIRQINKLPVARLLSDKITVAPNQEVLFIGTNSSDDGRIDYYLFEFGDGADSGWTTLSAVSHKYVLYGNYTVKLTVMDDFGAKSNPVNITINVQNLSPLDVHLTLSTGKIGSSGNVSLTVQVNIGGNPVENASVKLLSIGGSIIPESGLTDSNGQFAATFMAPSVTKETNIMIIATVSKEGYADGSKYDYVKVLPPLTVDLQVEPTFLKSEEKVSMYVYVAHIEQPVSEALVEISSNLTGYFVNSGLTDLNGFCAFNFTAPPVSEKTVIEITAVASKEEYMDGVAYAIILVEPKNMTVQVSVYPETIFSAENSTVNVYVAYQGFPLEGAQVSVTASMGSLSADMEFTDLNGEASFIYQAPIVLEDTTVTLNITVSKAGYYDITLQSTITVQPKILTVEVEAYPETAFSEESVNISVYVTFNEQPIEGANVLVTSDLGNFSAEGVTNLDGFYAFNFTAPPVNQQTNMTIFVSASKEGYVSNSSFVTIVLKPGILTLEVSVNPSMANPGQPITLTVHVKRNETDMQGVLVAVTADFGNFSGYTDSNGLCTFQFDAPQVDTATSFVLTVSASKDGYVTAQEKCYLDVIPAGGGGFPLTTLLIILAIILIVVVVIVLLFRFRVIEVAREEEEA